MEEVLAEAIAAEDPRVAMAEMAAEVGVGTERWAELAGKEE